jgi:hypothetical protein
LTVQDKPKVFGVGLSKTGTTSLARALGDVGYRVGNQHRAEFLLTPYARCDFAPILAHCRTAGAFLDFPFFFLDTCQEVDGAFPGSRFILTLRDDAEQWYRSLIAFLSKLFGHGEVPTAADLRRATYVWPGWMRESVRLAYRTPDEDVLGHDALVASYVAHNEGILEYFADRPGDLLVINLADADAYARFCAFLDIDSPPYTRFPWENRTEDIVVDSAGHVTRKVSAT